MPRMRGERPTAKSGQPCINTLSKPSPARPQTCRNTPCEGQLKHAQPRTASRSRPVVLRPCRRSIRSPAPPPHPAPGPTPSPAKNSTTGLTPRAHTTPSLFWASSRTQTTNVEVVPHRTSKAGISNPPAYIDTRLSTWSNGLKPCNSWQMGLTGRYTRGNVAENCRSNKRKDSEEQKRTWTFKKAEPAWHQATNSRRAAGLVLVRGCSPVRGQLSISCDRMMG